MATLAVDELTVDFIELEEIPMSGSSSMEPLCYDSSLQEELPYEILDTPCGPVRVTVQGSRNKPAILTYHDAGMNHESCFDRFLSHRAMEELVPLFCWIHIDAPGQEKNAALLPEKYVYPSMTELAQQVEVVIMHLRLKYVLGIGLGLGANVLARLAMISPSSVRGLILINLEPEDMPKSTLSYYTHKITKCLFGGFKKQERDTTTPTLPSGILSAKVLSSYVDFIAQQNPHNLSLLLHSYSQRTSIFHEFVTKARCKCLFIVTSDFEHKDDIIHLSSNRIPGKSTFLEIPNSSQLILDEYPEKISISMRLFLQGLGHAVTLGMPTPFKISIPR